MLRVAKNAKRIARTFHDQKKAQDKVFDDEDKLSERSDEDDTSCEGESQGVKVVVPAHLNPKKPKKSQKKEEATMLGTIHEETDEHNSSKMSSFPSGISVNQDELDNFKFDDSDDDMVIPEPNLKKKPTLFMQ